MFEFFLIPGILLLLLFFIDDPLLLLLCMIPLVPSVYAMLTGAPSVPTPAHIMEKMFKLARIKAGETVYDLGCGDGRLVFKAVDHKAKAIGFELSLPVYVYAKILSFFRGGSIRLRNFWRQDLSDADVIFCYLLTDSMQTFKKRIWPTLKPGTRVISHAFAMKGIEPVKQIDNVRLYVKK